jgi:hypothetical protein
MRGHVRERGARRARSARGAALSTENAADADTVAAAIVVRTPHG